MLPFEIPGYRILRAIGQGGMAEVYLAEQRNLGREVAIKLLSPALAADPDFVARFEREARLVARLNHPHIVTIHDIGVVAHRPYLALEYIAGGDLRARLHGQALPPDQALDIIAQLASALQLAHSHHIIHRDIKPENILFRPQGAAVIGDFGIAKAVNSATRFTQTGMIVGSPFYMSPEQGRGLELDGRADLYALGIILHELLTGVVPYDAPDTFALVLKHFTEPVPQLQGPLSRYQPLIDQLLAKEPAERFADADALLAAIGQYQHLPPLPDPTDADTLILSPGAPESGQQPRDPTPLPETDPSAPPPSRPQPAPAITPTAQGPAPTPEPPKAPPARSSKPRVLTAMAGVLLLLSAAAIGWWWLHGGSLGDAPTLATTAPTAASDASPPAPEPATPQPRPTTVPEPPLPKLLGYLQVTTNAPDTDVHLNGKRLGVANPGQPLEYRTGLPAGSAELTARAPEHQDQRQRVSIQANEWTQVTLNLTPEGPDLDAILDTCRAHMAAQRYTNPEDANAVLCYQEIERLDPGNREAKQAFADMSAFYLDSGQSALQAGNRERVADRIERLRRIDPDSPAAAQLEAALAKNPEPPPEPARQSFEPQMVAIRGGCFEMGSPPSEEGRDSDERQHRVCVDGFKIGQYEVTQSQWEAVMGNNPSKFSGCANCPVESVSWNDVQDYIGKLNARTGKRYRLPTEAEWEYAARAGSTTAYPWGNSVGRNRANCDGCGSQWDNKRTVPVGSFQPNAWGLYDTAGNVWEWTCSAYDEDYGGAEQRCVSNNHADRLAVRGGSWGNEPGGVRAANRGGSDAVYRFYILGLRLALD